MSQTSQPASRPAPRSKRPLWRTLVGIAIVLLVAAALAFLLSRCASGGGGAGGRQRRPSVTVGVAKATVGDVPITLSALGTVTPEATVSVTSQVSGALNEVDFHEGQIVRKGALLARIDARSYAAAVQQAQGQLLRDQALLANARVDLERYRTLSAQDSIAKQQLDTQASLVKQDEGVVASDKGSLAAAQVNLSNTRIVSPVAGRVGLRQIDPGNLISVNSSTPIAVVTEIDPIDVVFAVPEDAIPQITRHPDFGAGLPVTAYDRSGGQSLAQGSLATVDNVVDTTTGTVKGKARFANPTDALFPNQFVNVTVLVDTLKNQVIVPTTAIRHGPQGDFVYVLQPDQTVKVRAVTVGPATGETSSISKGLAVNETVITEGGDRLRDGAKVVLPGQQPRGGAGGGRHRRGGGAGGGGGDGGGPPGGGPPGGGPG